MKVTEQTPIKFRNAQISGKGNNWMPISTSEDAGSEDKTLASENKARLQEHLKGILTNYNVTVLVGSGASLNAVSPGVGGPKMGDLWETISKWSEFENISAKVNYTTGENIEELLSQCHTSLSFLGTDDLADVEKFIEKAEQHIYQACTEFLADEPSLPFHEELLDKLTKRKSRFPRAKIFTTNYDLCFETAAAKKGLTIIDGFSYSQPRRFNPNFFEYDIVRRAKTSSESNELVEGIVQLYKIHGSVDWEVGESGIRQVSVPAKDKRCLIYPAATKYQHSYTQPYLEMMARFLMSLREPNSSLIVVGFGFNDAHLKAPIIAAIQSNPSLNVVVVDPAAEVASTFSYPEVAKFSSSRVTLLTATFGQFTEIVPQLKAHSWESDSEDNT